jgi:RNA-directed DNA polymerase
MPTAKRSRNRPETIYFLGLTLHCTRNQKGNFKVGMRTEKSRLKRGLLCLRELMWRAVERYWRRMLRSRSWASRRLTWDAFNQIEERTPLLKPKLRLPYRKLQALAVL